MKFVVFVTFTPYNKFSLFVFCNNEFNPVPNRSVSNGKTVMFYFLDIMYWKNNIYNRVVIAVIFYKNHFFNIIICI